jgi:glutathione-specific gamma-glutamylcyclotransferase
MPRMARQMALTAELVARVHRIVEEPDRVYHTEQDSDAASLASHSGGGDAWLFAYGSLIWKPEVDHVEERIGTARGWHRALCLRLTRWRGTREKPGLMMALDRGGECKGVAYRLAGNTVEAQLGKLFRREMSLKPPTNVPCWIVVQTDNGPLRALAFVSNRNGQSYAGKRTLEETADILSEACGHWARAPNISTTRSRISKRAGSMTATYGGSSTSWPSAFQLCRVRRPRIEPRQKECERW